MSHSLCILLGKADFPMLFDFLANSRRNTVVYSLLNHSKAVSNGCRGPLVDTDAERFGGQNMSWL